MSTMELSTGVAPGNNMQIEWHGQNRMIFSIDQFDNENLIINFARGLQSDVWAQLNNFCKTFKERKWVNDGQDMGWKVPLNRETIAHIDSLYKMGEDYSMTANAQAMLAYQKISTLVTGAKAGKRWDYIFNDAATTFRYPSPVAPMDHQRVAVEAMYGAEYFGLLMEMGTGKTKCIIDEIGCYARDLSEDQIFRALIVCPKSLRVNWKREFAKNMSGVHNYAIAILDGQTAMLETLVALIRDPAPIKIGLVSYDSVRGMLNALAMFQPTYLALDESQYIKSPDSKRFKSIKELAKLAHMRRILTGTPVANTILDVWSQFQILQPGVLGFNSFSGFKSEFCDITRITVGARDIDKVNGFRNLDKLKESMAQCSFIVKKERCLYLPERLYEIRRVEMPDAVRGLYNKFEADFELSLNGMQMETKIVIVQMLKLAQICCGFAVGHEQIGEDDDEDLQIVRKQTTIIGGDAKMVEMIEDIKDAIDSTKIIVWCRFNFDVDVLAMRLRAIGIGVVTYDGRTKDKDRTKAMDSFNTDSSVRVFISKVSAGGVGLTLLGNQEIDCDKCKMTFFYSNGWSLGQREQAEARNHRIGQRNPVLYRDYVYEDTIEEKIAAALQAKKDIAEYMKSVESIRQLLTGAA